MGGSESEAVRNLVERLKGGDADAAAALYRLYADQVYRYVYYQTRDADLAADLTSEVFLRMLEHIGRYSHRGVPFRAWLFKIAHNLVVDHFRERGRFAPAEGLPDETGTGEPDPPGLDRDQLAEALARLTAEQRQVVLLRFIEDLDIKEVAAILGKTEGAVKALQHRALAALRRLLEGDGNAWA